MASYLDTFTSILPQSQRDRLLAALAVDEDLTNKSEEEYEETIRRLLEKLGKKEVTMKFRPQDGQTNSENYNQVLKEIYTDLHNIYQESNTLDSIISNHHQLNLAILSQVKKDIKRLQKRIDMLNLLADNNEGFMSASHEGFIDNTLWESRQSRPDLYRGDIPDAVRDEFDNSLKLGMSSRFNRIDRNVKIEMLEQVGEGFRGNTEHPIGQAIDDDPESFWAEVILADEPLRVPMGGVDRGAICRFKITLPVPSTVSYLGFNPYTQYPLEIISVGYTVDDSDDIHGYVLPIVNEPRLIESQTVYDFPSVTAKSLIVTIRQLHATRNQYRISKSSLHDKEMWRRIREAETKLTLSNTDWIREDGTRITNEQLDEKAIEGLDSTWQAYKDALKRYNSNRTAATFAGLIAAAVAVMSGVGVLASAGTGVAIKELLDPNAPHKVERILVDKYEYIYGMYNIAVEGREYFDSSMYVSKMHTGTGNIMQVALEADEWHPQFTEADGTVINKHGVAEPLRRTSVEYSVAYKDHPSEEDWINILPLGQLSVNNEFLVPDSPQNPKVITRFPVNLGKTIRLYKNEELIPSDLNGSPQYWWEDITTKTDGSQHSKTLILAPYLWDATARWTIDYTPYGDVHTIDFTSINAVPTDITEEFDGADRNGRVTLSHFPYVDYKEVRDNALYNPVKVTLEGIIEGNVNTKGKAITDPITSIRDTQAAIDDAKGNNEPAVCMNVTRYTENTLPQLDPYNPKDSLPAFEYAHEGKQVYLSESFTNNGPEDNHGITHGNAKITVSYQYLIPGVRVRVVLRRTSEIDKSATPRVYSYTLKFKSIN